MACCGGDNESFAKNELINRELRDEKRRLENEVKLLLLGAGESGKSTIAKQMKIIHKEGFTPEEKAGFKPIIYNNVVSAMRTLVQAANDLGIKLKAKGAAAKIMAGGEEYFAGPLAPELSDAIKELWQDPAIRSTFEQSSKFQLIDSAQYYFDNITRVAKPDYMPTEQDLLRSRSKTTGIIEIEFDVDKTHFRMVDVGGQRSERKKWMHCFQEVTAVIFCVALSEYDLTLEEDRSTNRMHESLKLFREICNSKWFVETAMILFLNKRDLFEEKVRRVDLNVCFREYTGGKDYKAAIQFIQDTFAAQNENPSKLIYPHVTCATDTDNIAVVFSVVKDTILRKALDAAHII